MEINFTIVKRKASPLIQALVSLCTGWSGMLVCKFMDIGGNSPYLAAFIGILFFVLINTIVSIAYESYFRYTVPSYYLYVALVAVLFLSAKQISGISIWTLKIYQNMLISISLFYFMVSIMVRIARFIFENTQKGF